MTVTEILAAMRSGTTTAYMAEWLEGFHCGIMDSLMPDNPSSAFMDGFIEANR